MFRGNLRLTAESLGLAFAYVTVIVVLMYPALSAGRFIS